MNFENLYSPNKVHPVANNEKKNNIKLTKLTRNNTLIHTAYIQHDVTISNIPCTEDLYLFIYFYQSTMLSSRAVDGHQMYFRGSVVGKASTTAV